MEGLRVSHLYELVEVSVSLVLKLDALREHKVVSGATPVLQHPCLVTRHHHIICAVVLREVEILHYWRLASHPL